MSAPKPPCCGQCQEKLQSCSTDVACCLECHFAYEEKYAFPYLPPSGRHILRRQHKWLQSMGFPHDAVEEHAQYEMMWFRKYCPPEICDQIEADHVEYGEGGLESREAV